MATETVTADFTVFPGETLSFHNENAFNFAPPTGSPGPNLDVQGQVVDNFDSGAPAAGLNVHGQYAISGGYPSIHRGAVTIENGASVHVTSTSGQGVAGALYFESWSPDVINHGQVSVAATGAAVGFMTWDGTPPTFLNTGEIDVTGSQAVGVVGINGMLFTNNGHIDVTSTSDPAGDVYGFIGPPHAPTGLVIQGFNGSFLNTGTIEVHDSSTSIESVGVYWASTFDDGSFVNRGVIEADIALKATQYAPSFTPQQFDNEGTMDGKVEFAAPSWGFGDVNVDFVNGGRITGDVTFDSTDDTFDGRAGTLFGVLHAGSGNDSIAGGANGETLNGDAGTDTIVGGAGDDVIDGGRDPDHLDGGGGINTVSYQDATAGVNLDLAAGTASSSGVDTLANFQRVIGGSLDDTLAGTAGGDTLSGGAGDDVISDPSGSNYLRGDEGDDSISGGSGFDDINGNMGNDTIHGNGGDDYSVGGKNDDLLFGDDGNDIVWGNLGNDTCDGGNGNDQCRGGQGDDSLSGGAGDDFISGDRGADTESGGTGADIFHTFSGAGVDKVLDFNLAEGDRVMVDPGTAFSVSQVGADTVIDMGAGDQMILVGVQMSTLTGSWIFGA